MMSHYKYPRTPHLTWSHATNDDRVLSSHDHFSGMQVVVTEKLDGESCSMYSDHIHARSIDGKDHPTRHWVKLLHARVRYDIPEGWRVCGENLYAMHSIYYHYLPSYFLVYSIWNENNVCLTWEQTKEWATLLGLLTVPELYVGEWDEGKIKQCWAGKSRFGDMQEGYVVRNKNSFPYDQFALNVAKYVRANHVQTDSHWMSQQIFPNRLEIGHESSRIAYDA
ncbi:MAG: RNA ligase family protein [Proteobacteria bacterium]|nr:RNA ligase family protein [Pseudomonadota bacterium]